MASEVKAEVDSLGDEIDSLRERAGVPKSKEEDAEATTISETSTIESSQPAWSESIQRTATEEDAQRKGLRGRVDGLPPKGGPS